MRYAFKNSFNRAFKKLTVDEQTAVQSSLSTLFDFLERRTTLPVGLGLKLVGKSYWEARSGLKIRILFELEGGLATFYFVGDHDQIRRFIRH
jgi:mRNA-degrading endonuclease RelE of RelBE toxin-antitoxin system